MVITIKIAKKGNQSEIGNKMIMEKKRILCANLVLLLWVYGCTR